MTLPPQRIGDKGQRYEVRYWRESDEVTVFRKLGSADTLAVAREMAKTWRKNENVWRVWIHDRVDGKEMAN